VTLEESLSKQQALLWATVFACLLAFLTPAIFGSLQPDYSHVRDYISELGANGAPYAKWVNLLGFLPLGILVAVISFLLPTILPRTRLGLVASLCLLSVSVGYLGAVLAPCDSGCPAEGSTSQQIHNFLGLIEYLGAAISFLLFAGALTRIPQWRKVGWLALFTAITVLICFTLLILPDFQAWRGLWQRVAECAIFFWLLIVGIFGTSQRSPVVADKR
jgi:hypothetical membrane protein